MVFIFIDIRFLKYLWKYVGKMLFQEPCRKHKCHFFFSVSKCISILFFTELVSPAKKRLSVIN